MSEPLIDDPALVRWARRALTIPGFVLAAVVSLLLVPALLPFTVAADLARGRPLPVTRALVFLAFVLWCEVAGIVAASALVVPGLLVAPRTFLRWNFRLQWWWASLLFAGARRVFGLTLEVEGDDQVGRGPLLVLIRHTSVADTLLPVVLISRRHGLELRYVLKRELLWDPCLDLVGHRLPNVFIRRGSERSEREVEQVRRLAQGLGPDEGVLIYPEGTRFTEKKRVQVLEKLAVSARASLVTKARALTHTLPPRLGGPLALIEEAGSSDVLFVAHSGFDGATTLADLWRGTVVGARVRVKMWRVPRAAIPTDPDERADWLMDEWAKVDAWVRDSGA